MRLYTFFLFLAGALLSLVPGCKVAAADDDALAVASEAANAADPLNTANSIYFKARADDRNCFAPGCGGFFVQRVNRVVTRCPDDTTQAECYVADIDTSALQLDAAANADLRTNVGLFLLRGTLTHKRIPGAGDQGVLQLSEAWKGHSGQSPQGIYLRVTNSGIICVTFPCLSYTGARLNSDQPPQNFADVNFMNGTGNTGDDARTQLGKPAGVLIAAQLATVTGPAGTAQALAATEYYLPFTAMVTATGCGGPSQLPCPAEQFCQYQSDANCGRTNQLGVCTTPPEVCPQIVLPVCGCDGKTYVNACTAAAARVSVDYTGECQTQQS